MSCVETVRRAIRFQNPDRLPLVFESLHRSDIGGCGLDFPSARTRGDGRGTDHFGCVWDKTEAHNMGQVKGHPLTAGPAALRGYAWPDPDNPAYYARIPEVMAARAFP